MGKRGTGEGTIRKRTDGRWEARVHADHVDGRRVRKSVYGDTRQEVQEKLTRVLSDHKHSIPVSDGRQTLGDYLSKWVEEFAKPRLKARTLEGYRDQITRHLTPLSAIPLTKLSGLDIQRWLNAKSDSHAPRTVRFMFAVLRSAVRDALRLGLIQRDPTVAVRAPRTARYEPRFLFSGRSLATA